MRSATCRSTPQTRRFNNPQGGEQQEFAPSIQFDTKGVEFGPWLRRFVAQIRRNWFIPYAAMSMRGHVVVTFNVHKDGRITDVQVAAAVADRRLQPLRASTRILASNPTHAAAAGVSRREGVLHRHLLLQRDAAGADAMTAARVAAVGLARDRSPRSAARSAHRAGGARRAGVRPRARRAVTSRPPLVAIARSDRDRQERARHRAGAALRRRDRQLRLDRGLSRLRHRHRQGAAAEQQRHSRIISIDIADPTEEYSAARYARERRRRSATSPRAAGCRSWSAAPGFYYRALTRGLVSRARAATRRCARGSSAIAERRGPERLHRMLRAGRSRRRRRAFSRAIGSGSSRARGLSADRPAADRALRRDRVAAARLRGRSPSRCGFRRTLTAERVARRVDAQFERGLLDEIRGLLARGVPETRAPVRRPRLPAGARAPARRARRGRDARADRAGEPAIRAAAVDLVHERA